MERDRSKLVPAGLETVGEIALLLCYVGVAFLIFLSSIGALVVAFFWLRGLL